MESEELKVVDGIKYSEAGIPILELPEPIPVKPPKYTYEEYEQEHTAWKKGRKSEGNWRKEQRRRWREGFKDLTGIHYFYLTQIQIADSFGDPIRPKWRDADDTIFTEFDYCYKNGIDLYVFKRREIGLSSIFGGVIPLWMLIMHPNSNTAMTSADLTRVKELLSNKLIFQHAVLEDWIKPKRKTYEPSSGATFQEIDENGEVGDNTAKITCRQTSQDKKDVTNLEGPRLIYAFLDELFQHPFPQHVRGSVLGSMRKGLKKIGVIVAGGSAGSITRLGKEEALKIVKQAETNSLRTLFMKGTEAIDAADVKNDKGENISEENFCINGWSDSKRAEAYIKWQRAVLDLSADKTELNWFIKQYPLTMDEVLMSDEVGVIPEEITNAIPAQERELKNFPRNIRRVRVYLDENGKPSFINDPQGAWMIVEEPVTGRTYEMGTDMAKQLMTKEEATMDPKSTKRSMNCAVIKCVETDTYVAIYLRRTSDEKLIYREISIAQKLYMDCKNMVERNTMDVLYLGYKYDNNLDALAYQPKWIGSKGWKAKTIRGVYKAGNEEKILTALFAYFRVYLHNVDFPIVLEQLKVFGIENADIMDAMAMCEVLSKGREVTDGQRALEAMKICYREIPITTTRNGKRHVEYKKVQIGGETENRSPGGMVWKPTT
jgi:hypothetical protein